MSNGYFLADTNSLVYAYRAGGPELLDDYIRLADGQQRKFAITRTIELEIEKGPLGKDLLRFLAEREIPVLSTPETEQKLRTGKISPKSAGEVSMLEVATQENASGRTTRIWSDDKYFDSPQIMRNAPSAEPITSAGLLNESFDQEYIDKKSYQRYRAGYETQADFRPGESPRLNTFRYSFESPEPSADEPRLQLAPASDAEAHRSVGAPRTGSLDIELTRTDAPLVRASIPEPELPGLRRALGAGAAVLPGAALAAYEFKQTLEYAKTQQDVLDNPRAGEDALRREGAQVAAGAIGSATGYGAALAAGAGSGGTFLLVAGSAYLASEVADKAMDWWEHNKIVSQTDRDGIAWKFKGTHWESQNLRGDLTDDNAHNPESQKFSALPEKARELSYMASNVAVEQALGKVPDPRNPFVQPADDSDTYSMRYRPWVYQADSGQWMREVVTGEDHRGIPNNFKDIEAGPERAAQLSAQAMQVIDANLKQGSAVIAAEYQIAYKRYGWSNDGPESIAVKAHLDPNLLEASDGKHYRRDAQGQWTHEDGAASANRALELELTRDRLLPGLQQHTQSLAQMREWQAPTAEQRDRDLLAREYAIHGVAPTPEQFEAAYIAVERTRANHGLHMANTSLDLVPDAKQQFSIESPIQHLRMQQKDVVEVVATTTAADISLARDAVPIRAPGGRGSPDRDGPEQEQPPQPPRRAELISDPGFDALAYQTWLQTRSALDRSPVEGLDDLTQDQRERLTANVAARVVGDVQTGMTDVTRIDASTITNSQTGMPQFLISGQGDPTTAHYKRVAVDVAQAIDTSVERSSEIAKAGVDAREQKQAQDIAQAQTMNQEGPSGPTMKIGSRTIAMASSDSGGSDGGGGAG